MEAVSHGDADSLSMKHPTEISKKAKVRAVEVGSITHKVRFTIYLSFVGFPIWLLCLESALVHVVYVLQHQDLASMMFCLSKCFDQQLLDLVIFLLHRIGLSRFHFGSVKEVTLHNEPLAHVLHLGSGDVGYMSEYLSIAPASGIKWAILDHDFKGRLHKGHPTGHCNPSIVWHCIRHTSVGGCTSFRGLVGMSSNCSIQPKWSILRRTLRSIIDFGIRPTPFTPNRALAAQPNAYTIDDKLLVGFYDRQVIIPTSFCSSGWGRRTLQYSELAKAHGFSRVLAHRSDQITSRIFTFPPVQIMDSIFDSYMDHIWLQRDIISSPTPPSRVVPPSEAPSGAPLDTSRSWIPGIHQFLSHDWIDETLVTTKAQKHDSAAVPAHLWDSRICLIFPAYVSLLQFFRKYLLARHRRSVTNEACLYMTHRYGKDWCARLCYHRSTHGLLQSRSRGDEDTVYQNKCKDKGRLTRSSQVQDMVEDAEAIGILLSQLTKCSWWEWEGGSSLLFWRWGKFQLMAREGMQPFISGELPSNRKPARKPPIQKFPLVASKLKTIVDRAYVRPGFVRSLTDYFDVPKGEDIRLVYNGSSCGLNKAVWAPNFWLPYPRSALRLLDYNYYSVDMDLGEMFLNFPLHPTMQPYAGIDLTHFKQDLGISTAQSGWYRWTRNWMGARPSPYSSVRYFYIAEEFCRGYRAESTNPLRWDKIILNLPGSPDYDPSKPRVYKWDAVRKQIAGDFITFVDDLRLTAATIELCWQIARLVASRLQYLGIQEASRKRRPPTRSPGAWAGAIFETSANTITKTVSIDKWEKAKRIVNDLWSQLDNDEWNKVELDYKGLESGFLGHLSMTFEVLVPFLKGFHLTLASYLPQRDKEGWKMSDKEWRIFLEKEKEKCFDDWSPMDLHDSETYETNIQPPKKITAVPLLKDDLFALRQFFLSDNPPIVSDRCRNVQIVNYGFGDASGTGFGSMVQTPTGVHYRIGVWGADEEDESSNYKEFENVVDTVEDELKSGRLKDSVLFFFTDNSTVEAALYKGNSKSKKLFGLIVRFRKLQLDFGIQIVVSHVSGKRMVAQGTDGVSRGCLKEGVAGSEGNMLNYIPLHLDAFQRHSNLDLWLKSWIKFPFEILNPEDWYERGHDHAGGYRDNKNFWRINTKPGIFVWAPPPGAAAVALEEMRRAILKRQRSTHIFLCPRLLTTEWRKQLNKAADIVVSLGAGVDESGWPLSMHEPLTIAFVFPLLPFSPWQRRGTPKLCHMARTMSGLRERKDLVASNLLLKFFSEQQSLASLPESLVRKLLYYTSGDNVLCKDSGNRQQ